MNRLKSACPTWLTALSTHIRASLFGLSSLAMLAVPMVSHADLSPTQQDLTKLYLASFLRAPDLGGLNYWNAQLASGSTLQTVGGTIFSLPIVREIYPQGMSDRDFVESIYGNVFQRESDLEGLNYWMKELANLRTFFDLTITDGLSAERARGQLVMNMINAGLGTPDGTAGKASIVNRFNVAKLAAEEQLKRGMEIPPAKLKAIGACVNSSATSTTTALDEIQNFYNPIYKLGGTVTGLSIEIGLSVKYGCGKIYNISSNGVFTLPEGFAPGVNYSVSINSQPVKQECSIVNGGGLILGGDVRNIQVICKDMFPVLSQVLITVPKATIDILPKDQSYIAVSKVTKQSSLLSEQTTKIQSSDKNDLIALANDDGIPMLIAFKTDGADNLDLSVESSAMSFVLLNSLFSGQNINSENMKILKERILQHAKFKILADELAYQIKKGSPCPMDPECSYSAKLIADGLAKSVQYIDLVSGK